MSFRVITKYRSFNVQKTNEHVCLNISVHMFPFMHNIHTHAQNTHACTIKHMWIYAHKTCITKHMCKFMHNVHIHASHTHLCTTKHIWIYAPCTHTCTTHTPHAPPNTCVNLCNMYIHALQTHTCTTKHVHHQIPPKMRIYLVGLPSVLYERPDPNEISVLNQLFVVIFSVLFTFQVQKCTFHEKCTCFSYEKCRCFSQKAHALHMKSTGAFDEKHTFHKKHTLFK